MKNNIVIGVGIAIAVIVGIVVATQMGEPQSNVPGMVEQPEDAALVQDERIKVVASFYPYYEFTKNVAGDHAHVEQFLPSGVEAHDWEPLASDIRSLKDADVFVYNGLGLESYIDSMIGSDEFDHIVFIKASDSVELLKSTDDHGHADDGHEMEHDEHAGEFIEELAHVIEEFEEGHLDGAAALEEIDMILHQHADDGHDEERYLIEGIEEILYEIEDGHYTLKEGIEEIHHFIMEEKEYMGHDEPKEGHEEEHNGGHEEEGHHDFEFDPHIWLDPILVKQQILNIRDGLIEVDSKNKEHYEQNAADYIAELDILDADIRSSLSSCERDTFVPFHNAFSYFADRYGLHIVPLAGIAPDAEASAMEIAEFVDYIIENDIKVIFSEELVDPRLAEVIAGEAGAEVMLLSPVEALAADDPPDTSFIEKMNQNLDALRVALECR